jgi:hypothetical protein
LDAFAYSVVVCPACGTAQKSSSRLKRPWPAYWRIVMPGKSTVPFPLGWPRLHVHADAARPGIDHVPLVGGVELGVLRHDRLDPRAHRLAAVHRAEDVLDVDDVVGEALDPGVPVLADGAAAPVALERRLDLLAGERGHGAP